MSHKQPDIKHLKLVAYKLIHNEFKKLSTLNRNKIKNIFKEIPSNDELKSHSKSLQDFIDKFKQYSDFISLAEFKDYLSQVIPNIKTTLKDLQKSNPLEPEHKINFLHYANPFNIYQDFIKL